MVKRLGNHETGPAWRRYVGSRRASPFVGRADDLHYIVAGLTLAAEGQGSILFLSGQPGIGKTRLAREGLALARERGFTVLEGRAHPLESGLAYGPFLGAFRPLLRSFDIARLELIASDMPSLGRLFEGLRLPLPPFPLEGLGDPALEKTRIFGAMLCLFERLAQEAPVAFFLDDLQWADPATLELVHHLARSVSDQRCLLLAAYGSDALDVSPRLRLMVGSLLRDGLAKEIIIARLGRDEVERLVRGTLDGQVPADMLHLLEARAGGTPLFVEAIIAALLDSGNLVRDPSRTDAWLLSAEGRNVLPSSVRHLILARLERLDPIDRQILELVAVMGVATPHVILRAASGLEEGDLINALRRLRGSGLVAEGMDGSEVVYSLTHPLIQEVAYAELPEIARRRVHVAAVRALESITEGRPGRIEPLARHYLGAGPEADRGRALGVLLMAGERCREVYANEEAARYYAAALAMVREGHYAESLETPSCTLHPPPSALSEVLERLGEASERIGKVGAAVEVWSEALTDRERAGDAQAAARLHRQLALAEWDLGHFDIANAHLDAGLAVLALQGEDESCQEFAELRYARVGILGRLGDLAGMANTAGELLSSAQGLASPRVEAEVSLASSSLSLEQGDVASACERAERALTIGEQAQELQICFLAHARLALIGMFEGDHQLMRYHAVRGLAACRRLGAPYMEASLRRYLAYAEFMSGAWDQALRDSMETVALARRLGHPRILAYCLAVQSLMRVFHGDLSEAEAYISEARAVFGSPSEEGLVDSFVFGLLNIAETALLLERGQADRALSLASGFVGPPKSPDAPAGLTRGYMPLGLMLLAEAQVAAGNPEGALETAGKLVGLSPTGIPYHAALASRAEGHARQAMGQRGAALACLARAHETFTTLQMPFEAARCLLKQAEAWGPGVGGRGPEVREQGLGVSPASTVPCSLTPVPQPLTPALAARQSLAVFERLGARLYADRAGQLLRQLGVARPATRRTRRTVGELTTRELDIARLAAEGLTAREIAKHLIISQRTVSNHLAHIYDRLDISSRAALSRFVSKKAGLL